jgi:hypothetical protein
MLPPSRALSLLFVLLASSLVTGCTHVRPWERGKLAHPTMSTGIVPGPAEEHVYAVQEGAIGGSGGAESGCGCN